MRFTIRSSVPEIAALRISPLMSSGRVALKQAARRGEVVLGINSKGGLTLLGKMRERATRGGMRQNSRNHDVLLAAADLGLISKKAIALHLDGEKLYDEKQSRRHYVETAQDSLRNLGIKPPAKLRTVARGC